MTNARPDRYALFPELRAFEAVVGSDPEVLGVLYTGSLGRGDFDRFSDLDIGVWVPEEASRGPERRRRLLEALGEVRFAYSRGDTFTTAFVGPEWRRTDLDLLHQADLKPGSEFAGARVVKDTDGVLGRLVAEVPAAGAICTLEQARQRLEGAIDSQIYLALHNARGAVWSAMGEVTHCGTVLYALLAALRGRRSYGLRYVELLLSPEEERLLTAAWPTTPRRDEVRRAARALWTWTLHVRAEAERALGASLEIAVDEPGLLAAVDRIYGPDGA
jgi:hypothetical protein